MLADYYFLDFFELTHFVSFLGSLELLFSFLLDGNSFVFSLFVALIYKLFDRLEDSFSTSQRLLPHNDYSVAVVSVPSSSIGLVSLKHLLAL